MQKILISLLLAAAVPALAQTPKTKSETVKAEYCPRPSEKQECGKIEITRLMFAEQALTRVNTCVWNTLRATPCSAIRPTT